jgi:hypothetical protein
MSRHDGVGQAADLPVTDERPAGRARPHQIRAGATFLAVTEKR